MNASSRKTMWRILSISRDAVLLASRSAVLRQAGYQVESAMEDDRALQIVSGSAIDAVVIGDCVVCEQRNQLADAIRAADERVPIIVLRLAGETVPASATAGMDSLDGPEILLNLLRALLQESEAQAA